jgi:hypothetical protein
MGLRCLQHPDRRGGRLLQQQFGRDFVTTNRLACAGVGKLSCVAIVCAVAANVVGVRDACAATEFDPYATVSYLHNSNVFSRPSDEPPFAAEGNHSLGDSLTTYLVGGTGEFDLGLERLSLFAQGSHVSYDRFTELSHWENKFGGKLEWYLGALIDGTLNYGQSRTMAPLADTMSDVLEVQTEKSLGAIVHFRLTSHWRFDLEPSWHQLDTPLQQYPLFGFRETSGAAAINYLGINKLTAGLRFVYTDGSYHGIIGATKYNQVITQLTANYALTGFSSFDGQLGYTHRNSSYVNAADALGAGAGLLGNIGATESVTGSLGLTRRLSVKTSVSLKLYRDVDSYVAGANSAIDTGGEAAVKWDPDVRFSVVLRYRMGKQSIQGALAIDDFEVRTDRTRNTELDVEYHAMPWLTLRPYFLRDQRSSTIHDANYGDTVIGVDLTAKLHQRE